MHVIGIIGGMSWHSTAEYYRIINSEIAHRLGGHHSASLVIASLDFDEVRRHQIRGDWDAAGEMLADAGRRLQAAGAEHVLIATNLMHRVAPQVERALDVPLLHIADTVGRAARRADARRVGLLGTRWVMEEDFYQERLAVHGIEVLVPVEDARRRIDDIIFDELTHGVVNPASRDYYLEQIAALRDQGAEAVILGCTEIELLVTADVSPLPVIDSTACHAQEAVELMLAH